MEGGLDNAAELCFPTRLRLSFIESLEKLKVETIGLLKKIKKTGEDDPRRIVHSFKVGLALTLVSLIYYIKALYKGFGVSALWAVLTVVVIMEYTAGATLSKGLNRAFGTLLAGALGVGTHHVAALSGDIGEPIILGFFIFVLAASATFSRFIPKVKARYDYGVLVFMLTFSLVALSGYRVDELIVLAHQRLSTIAIGGFTCFCTSILVYPIWAGEELHKLVALNLEKLADYFEGIAGLAVEYFGEIRTENVIMENKPFLRDYKSILNAKTTEDSLANFARWEPGHGQFGFFHPWDQYSKIGALARQCAYCIEALNAHILTISETQVSQGFSTKIHMACREISSESGKALRELASAVRTMTNPSSADQYIVTSGLAVSELKSVLLEKDTFSDVLHAISIASLLIEISSCTQDIASSVKELALLANFKSSETLHRATVKPVFDEGTLVSITIGE